MLFTPGSYLNSGMLVVVSKTAPPVPVSVSTTGCETRSTGAPGVEQLGVEIGVMGQAVVVAIVPGRGTCAAFAAVALAAAHRHRAALRSAWRAVELFLRRIALHLSMHVGLPGSARRIAALLHSG